MGKSEIKELDPFQLYTRDQLVGLIGEETFFLLLRHGLIGFGGLFLGQIVFDSWRTAANVEWLGSGERPKVNKRKS